MWYLRSLFWYKLLSVSSRKYSSSKCVKKSDIRKILIANRGEIACRIMKSAKRMGIQTVAVYSDADKNSMHVSMADEAYHIGPPLSGESYLRGDRILSVAKKTESEAIHPGYGFLSENAEFAEACMKQGVIFIGPPAAAIRDMGIKSTSKALMQSAGVPVIKGYHEADQSDSNLIDQANRIGFPIMVKAIRGGGGKGMRVAMHAQEFADQLSSARREAMKSFGDDAVLLEQLILKPRHIEVQVFGDRYGNYVYLFERDCSVQRRHQKIIEEAPAPDISEELRKELGESAVRAAKAVGYVGAGTVEFIFDINSDKFYFMEMNTRLQVEHPITEMITRTDLVEWQILVAGGYELPVSQNDLKVHGHSVEARIYAEDPFNGFIPTPGKLLHLKVPDTTEFVRVETGVREGDEVSVYYDPMIAKLVVWAENRNKSFEKLRKELLDFHVAGVSTNIGFLLNLIQHPDMLSGNVHTGFIKQHENLLFENNSKTPLSALVQSALAIVMIENKELVKSAKHSINPHNPFVRLSGFRINLNFRRTFFLTNCRNNEKNEINVTYGKDNWFVIKIDNAVEFNVSGNLIENGSGYLLKSNFGYYLDSCELFKEGSQLYLFTKNNVNRFIYDDPRSFKLGDDETVSAMDAVSPMPGTVDQVLVNVGDKVKSGDPLLVVMAMKMEHIIKSPKDGVVECVLYKQGDHVDKDAPVVKWSQQ